MTAFVPKTRRDFRKVKKLYKEAFPKYERKPFFVIRAMQKRKKTDVFCFADREGFLGFATTLNGEKLILIDYLAIQKDRRGKGFGSEILCYLLNYYQDHGVFLEIETPDPDGENYSGKLRRKAFYEKAGFVPMHVRVTLFGVDMELLGARCTLDYADYHAFYRETYPFAADNITDITDRGGI